jgi:multiple sugar transport system permease protein
VIGTTRKRLLIALLFLLPNLVGFLLFTAGPVAFSLYMSFTDWQLTKHNQFSDEPVRFVGFDNYTRLLVGDESVFFWDYFWNTVFLMIAIPLSIFGSLALALMLNAKAAPERPKSRLLYAAIGGALTVAMCVGAYILLTPGAHLQGVASTETGLTDLSQFEVQSLRRNGAVLFVGLVGLVITAGLGIGQMFFRAAFYLPTLLAGVAMFLLWKTLYRPRGGLINSILDPILGSLEATVNATPAALWYGLGIVTALAAVFLAVKLTLTGITKLREGEAGPASFGARMTFMLTGVAAMIGMAFVLVQLPAKSLLPSGYAPLTAEQASATLSEFEAELAGDYDELEFRAVSAGFEGGGVAYRDALSQLVSLAGEENAGEVESIVQSNATRERSGFVAGEGLTPPEWLISSRWAKTALVIMAVWLGIGGGNMLLYLAGLSNIPPELYEASAIDGATGWQRFIHVTWPQLAPTTFFIVIMSTIAGLQGGFEQALVMTEGKADTIVLTYYLYNLAFNGNFQLGLASAVAWIMFVIIFAMTAFNFRFGSRMTNE